MNYKKLTLAAAVAVAAGSAFAQQVQPSNEVQVQQTAPQNSVVPGAVNIPFDGCAEQPPTPTCQRRIICVGEATIRMKGPDGVRMAKKSALLKANAAVAYFQKTLLDAQSSDKEQMLSYSKEDGAGKSSNQEIGQLQKEENSQRTQALLQGVVVVGGEVNVNPQDGLGSTKVYVGQSCKSIATAQGLQQQQASGGAAQGGAGSADPSNANARVMGGPAISSGSAASVSRPPSNDF